MELCSLKDRQLILVAIDRGVQLFMAGGGV